jgi:LytS/YehU family sensor histidine kinase
VVGKRDDKYIEISISNPVATGEKRAKGGNQMALANIRQRFELAYGNRAMVEVDDSESAYAVKLRFPHEKQT